MMIIRTITLRDQTLSDVNVSILDNNRVTITDVLSQNNVVVGAALGVAAAILGVTAQEVRNLAAG